MSTTIQVCRECNSALPEDATECSSCGSIDLGLEAGETYLECGHCGGAAIASDSGVFGEDEGVKCAECEFPGHVSVDEDGNGYWSESQELSARCNRSDCMECRDADRRELEVAKALLRRTREDFIRIRELRIEAPISLISSVAKTLSGIDELLGVKHEEAHSGKEVS